MLPDHSIIVEGLEGSSKALLAGEAVKRRSLLLITGGTREDEFVDNLAQVCPDKTVEFPAWETLPGEEIPPSPDIIGKRFETLDALLSRKEPLIVLCPLASLLQKIPPKEILSPLLHRWKKGMKIPFDTLPAFLSSLGYTQSAVVSDKGEFAIRGGILDLFPVASSDPFRIEFFGDEIEEIRTFDPVGQKSIGKAEEIFLCPAKELPLLQQAKRLVSIADYLDDPILFWDDLLAIEDTYVGIKSLPAAKSLFFYAFEDLLKRFDTSLQIFCTQFPLEERFEMFGHTFKAKRFHFSSKIELQKSTHLRRQKWRSTYHTPAAEFHELSPGDLVVHYHSGIGRYVGLEKQVNHLGKETEFLTLQYAENSKLFVPLSQSHLVSRYIGSREEPPSLSQIGSKKWQNTRANAQAQIVGYANELLQLYAERAVQGGIRYPADGDLMRQFEQDFPYTETHDQHLAIRALKEDMISVKPMDRLVCGDVGYGKTEVAMRAAFKAVVDGGKQVAVLVPTTVLAVQHFETFAKRMGGFPIQVGVVSRFQSTKELKETLEKLKTGKIDIVIGTHRLLSGDVSFKNLGLLIIDEEQRFGVKAKEHLKRFKANVDCLTLSATPIPRTLYMSLVHARDMSVINTPPQDRLPIKTIIAETDTEVIQNAILRELARGGQAFYIHNRVESIYTRADQLQKMVPSAKIGIVHGQMDPDAVDDIFHRFKQGELNLLLATTIIENGIDIPNANTILIERADTYGLADLYQLRGRVGRWNRAAYAYFLIPKNMRLTEPAQKRLGALVESGSYGGGMKIAMRDLEIRGAGNILGIQQSGQVSAVGFHLYCKMLKRAIDALKKQIPISFNETKMEFSFDARLPEDYINAVSLRMELYHRLGEANTPQEIDELLAEMKDRFGEPPLPVIWLYHLSRIRVFASANQFTLLKFSTLSLYTERQLGKELKKQTLLVPKKLQTPAELEKYVITELKKLL